MEPLNEIHKDIIMQIKFNCVNKKHGCRAKLSLKELHHHETTACNFLHIQASHKSQCPFCSKQLNGFQEKTHHFCNSQEDSMCPKHKDTWMLTTDRISYLEEVQNFIEYLKCGLCENLMKNPK